LKIRAATVDDHEALCAIDTVANTSPERRDQIRSWLDSARCCVAEVDGRIAGYGVLTHHFFGHPFIEIIMVGEAFRRQGVGAEIVRHLRAIAPGPKLFSSTNASNVPMQKLFRSLGFERSGQVDNLDEGDAEIIFLIVTG